MEIFTEQEHKVYEYSCRDFLNKIVEVSMNRITENQAYKLTLQKHNLTEWKKQSSI